jgi:hypothetical protein
MSRGPGHVERRVEKLFTRNPTKTFSTGDLIAKVYPGLEWIEKKHRVAVLRAATKVALRLGNWEKWKCERFFQNDLTDRGIIFVNVCDTRSYALGRLRTQQEYQWGGGMPVAALARHMERDENIKQYVARGGAWWRLVQQERVKRGAVLDAESQKLVATAEEESQQRLEMLAEKLKARP